MKNRLIHTPEGVRDIYGKDYLNKKEMLSKIQSTFDSFGYMNIQTPSFEFFDIFSKEIGTNPSKELYKFFDKENNTIVLRADFTPGVARSYAKYFAEENSAARLCYQGNVYRNISDLQGKLKETTQAGAELIGDESVAADAEVIAMMITALKASGIDDFKVCIGEVEYFKGICKSVGLDEKSEIALSELIAKKSLFGVRSFMEELEMSAQATAKIMAVADLYGSAEILEKAKKDANNEQSLNAVSRLCALNELLQIYGVSEYVSYDLGMLGQYNYYTGVVFQAYTYGAGTAIATGGRYDQLLVNFATSAPAVGFVIAADELFKVLKKQQIVNIEHKKHAIIIYEKNALHKAITFANDMRKEGKSAEIICSDERKVPEDYITFSRQGLVDEIYWADADKVVRKK